MRGLIAGCSVTICCFLFASAAEAADGRRSIDAPACKVDDRSKTLSGPCTITVEVTGDKARVVISVKGSEYTLKADFTASEFATWAAAAAEFLKRGDIATGPSLGSGSQILVYGKAEGAMLAMLILPEFNGGQINVPRDQALAFLGTSGPAPSAAGPAAQPPRNYLSVPFEAVAARSARLTPGFTGGHSESVVGVAFSADGTRVLTVGNDALRVWDARSGQPLATVSGATHAGALSPDGARALGALPQGSALFDVKSGAQLHRFPAGDRIDALAFSPDGKRLAVPDENGTIVVYDAATFGTVSSTKAPDIDVGSISFDAAGARYAACVATTAAAYDAATGKELARIKAHDGFILSCAISPDGKMLATGGGSDRTVRLWRIPGGDPIRTIDALASGTRGLAFSPDGKSLATTTFKASAIFSVDTGQLVRNLGEHKAQVFAVAFSPDGKSVATAGEDRTAKIWDAASGAERLALAGVSLPQVLAAAVSPDGALLATAGEDNLIHLWDLAAGKLALTLRGHRKAVNALAFAPDGRTLASGSADTSVRIWNVKTGELIKALVGNAGSVLSIAFGPGSALVSGGEDGNVKLWDTATGKSTRSFSVGDRHEVDAVAYAVDGKRVAAGGVDGRLDQWDLASGVRTQLAAGLGWIKGLAFRADGSVVIGADALTILGEDLVTVLARKVPAPIQALAVTERLIALGTEDGKLLLLRADGSQPRTLSGHTGAVRAVAIAGNLVASGGADGMVKAWGASSGAEFATAYGLRDDYLVLTPEGSYTRSDGMASLVRFADEPCSAVDGRARKPDAVLSSLRKARE